MFRASPRQGAALFRVSASGGTSSWASRSGRGPIFSQLPLAAWTIGSALIAVTLLLGGRHPVGRLGSVLAAVAVTVVVAFASRGNRWRYCGAEWLFLAATQLVMLQLLPLPGDLLAWLRPEFEGLLPSLERNPSGLPAWQTISVAPQQTREALAMWLVYGALFFAVHHWLVYSRAAGQLLRIIGWSTVGLALLGLAQYFFDNGRFLWIYDNPTRPSGGAVMGPFQNRNHFAHMMALGVGPLIYLALGNAPLARKWEQWLSTAGLALVGLASLLTYSRGGIAVVVLSAGMTALLMPRGAARKWPIWMLAASIVGWIGLALTINGGGRVVERLGSLSSGSIQSISSERWMLWQAMGRAIQASPLVGYGAASHSEVYPSFLDQATESKFTHGESGYLPLQLENGAIGSLLLLLAVLLAAVWWRRGWRSGGLTEKRLLAAVAGPLAASLAHSSMDFVWYIPACFATTLVLLACASSLSRPSPQDPSPLSGTRSQTGESEVWNVPSLGRVAMAFAILGWCFITLLPASRASYYWDAYRRLVRSDSGREDEGRPDKLAHAHWLLRQAAERHPHDGIVQTRLAQLTVSMIEADPEAPMSSLAMLQEAWLQGHHHKAAEIWQALPRQAQQQLVRAANHAARGMRETPLQASAYVTAAETSFLSHSRLPAADALLQHALRLRPHSGAIALRSGVLQARAGDVQACIASWRHGFQADPTERPGTLAVLCERLPAVLLVELLQPDPEGLRDIRWFFESTGNTSALRDLAPVLAEGIASLGRSRQDVGGRREGLVEASAFARQYGLHERAIGFAEEAVRTEPGHYDAHRLLVDLYRQQNRFAEAEAEVQWCLRRRRDPQLQAIQTELVRVRLAGRAAN